MEQRCSGYVQELAASDESYRQLSLGLLEVKASHEEARRQFGLQLLEKEGPMKICATGLPLTRWIGRKQMKEMVGRVGSKTDHFEGQSGLSTSTAGVCNGC